MKQDTPKPSAPAQKTGNESKSQKNPNKQVKTEKQQGGKSRGDSGRRDKRGNRTSVNPGSPLPHTDSETSQKSELDARRKGPDASPSSPSQKSVQGPSSLPIPYVEASAGPQLSSNLSYCIDPTNGEYRPSNYKTRLCIKWEQMGECSFGDRCNFAHGEHELRSPSSLSMENCEAWSRQNNHQCNSRSAPLNRKTRLCSKYHLFGVCPYADRCNFAHGMHELMPTSGNAYEYGAPPAATRQNYKTRLCLNWQQEAGHCPYGSRCHFAHGLHELRINGATESVGFAPPPPPIFFCSLMPGPPMPMASHDMCSPMGPPFCLPPAHMMPPMGSMQIGIPNHGGMFPMSACMGGGYIGQQLQMCSGGMEMQPHPQPNVGVAGGAAQEELPQVVQRLFAAYEHQPCVQQVAYPADMASAEGGWGGPGWQGPRAIPVLPVQDALSSREYMPEVDKLQISAQDTSST